MRIYSSPRMILIGNLELWKENFVWITVKHKGNENLNITGKNTQDHNKMDEEMLQGKIIKLIEEDEWMMEILWAAQALHLSDWWICAGFVRSKIWDVLHEHHERTLIPDIDVIYFDSQNMDEREEKVYERKLQSILPSIPWSVKNEARMHLRNKVLPYSSSADAIAKFPETATALGVKLDQEDNVVLAAPYGISDAANLMVKPTPFFTESEERMRIYKERLYRKNWKRVWKDLKIYVALNE